MPTPAVHSPAPAPSPPRSALELIPCGRVLATARYFQAGHLVLDSLARSLRLE